MSAPSCSSLAERKWQLLVAIARDPQPLDIDARVAIAMLDHLHRGDGPDHGHMWPSAPTVAAAANSSPRSVFRSLERLCVAGYLVPVHRGGGRSHRGGGRSNVYRMCDALPGTSNVATDDNVNVTTDGKVNYVTDGNVAICGTSTLPPVANKPVDKKEEVGDGTAPARAPRPTTPLVLVPIDGGKTKRPPRPAGKDRSLYRSEHGCTIDSYQPDADMAAWAAEHCPLVPDPLGRTLESIKDGCAISTRRSPSVISTRRCGPG